MKKKISVLRLIPPVFCLLLALGTATVFRACAAGEDGTWMHCHTAQTTVTWVSLALAAVSAVPLFSRNRILSAAVYAVCLIGACVLFLIPGEIVSMCMMSTMRCHAVMKPFVRVMAALTAVSGAAALVSGLREGKAGRGKRG